jgi:hypothetical protein
MPLRPHAAASPKKTDISTLMRCTVPVPTFAATGADQEPMLGNTLGGFRLNFCWDKYRIALSVSQRGSRSPAFAALMM